MRHITIIQLLNELNDGLINTAQSGADAGYFGQIQEILAWWSSENRAKSGFNPKKPRDLGRWYELFDDLLFYVT